MITAIVGLAVLKSKEKADGGLAQPDASFEVLKILLNYLPTVFATLLEPILKDMLAFDCPETYQPGALDTNKEMYTLPSGRSSAEVVDTVTQNFTLEGCDVTFILGWSRSSEVEAGDGRMETSFAMCRPVFTTAMFDLTVDTEGYVLEADRVSEHEEDLGYPDSIKHVESMIIVLNHLLRDNQMHWHNDTVSRDWFNYLIKIQPGFEDLLDPQTPVPNPDDLIPTIESLYRQLYALLLGLNDNIFERSEKPAIIEGTRQQTEVRIFIPLAAFIISIAVLSLNILTAVVLYTHGVKFFLPRMPTTVGSVLAYVAPSRAVSEYHDGGVALNKSTTFSFGRGNATVFVVETDFHEEEHL
ncbi:hypothetical protein HYQ44_002784 [Verticillium longisporum]|nr:hypothetical protein HYQ44_002784 [Verticillium longisporum]